MSVINSYNISTTPENNVLVNIGGEETVYNNGDMAWILVASALVFIMVVSSSRLCGLLSARLADSKA